ncbi:hypothetical protein M1105_09085 [Limibaculum sp. FT325]|uniref:hypothetical protein n=1 Tax=Thermohalobaculum sediminis TaxID=2939436 RepID=UPI0020BDCC58|nr:hypothetical protein [Limibaculum sediminis]MCL5777139.1 hypothetical protein [Limibaculum sediminis]
MPRPLTLLAALAALFALAGCEIDRELPWGGSFTMSPTEAFPGGGSLGASNAEACVGIDERGRRHLLPRSRCAGDSDGVVRD